MKAFLGIGREQEKTVPDVPDTDERPSSSGERIGRMLQNPATPVLLIAVLLCVCAWLWNDALSMGAKTASDAFHAAVDTTADTVYTEFYQRSYESAAAKYHVSNNVSISIGSLQEEAKLEVLSVSDVSYVVAQPEETGGSILSWALDALKGDVSTWVEVPGSGVYTVNLRAAEFLLDSQRQHVLLRVPEPELSSFRIDYDAVQVLHFDETGKPSVAQGEAHIREQLRKAESQMKEEIAANQRFYQSAKNSARTLLTYLIKELNPQIPDLTVDVEFME